MCLNTFSRSLQLELNSRLRKSRTENERLANEMARLQSEHTQLSSKYSQLMTNSSSEIQLLSQRIGEVESDRDNLKGWERRAKGLSIELEEERRRAVEGRREAEDDKEDKRVEEVMRNELKREFIWSTRPRADVQANRNTSRRSRNGARVFRSKLPT